MIPDWSSAAQVEVRAGPGKPVVCPSRLDTSILTRQYYGCQGPNIRFVDRASPMRWHCLQHVPFEGPGCLAAWTQSRGYALSGTNLWEQSTFPWTEEIDGLFIL